MSITIVPNGRGNKITALMYAIELHKKTNKKIHIIFTKQYDDIFYDLDRFFFDDLPNLLFKNISYELKEVKINPDYGYHLQLMMQNDEMNDIINKYAKDNDLKIYDSKVNESQISTLESGIITFTMTKEIKNNGIEDIKLWLSDITKYKIYDQFMKNINFDWINHDCELVSIYIPVSRFFDGIYYNFTDNYIPSPKYYQDALNIIKKKSNKPLQFIIITDVPSIYLTEYKDVINKYGQIIPLNDFIPQSYRLIIYSKSDYLIGSHDVFTALAASIFIDKIKLAICSVFDNVNKYKYTDNVMFLDKNIYKINTSRNLQFLSIRYSLGYKRKFEEYKTLYCYHKNQKDQLYKTYNYLYSEFDKYNKSNYFKDLLLYKVLFKRNKARLVNSNISISEGLMIYKLIKQYKPKKLIETGLASGISTCYMLNAISSGDKIYSIDPFQKIQWDRFGLINVYEVANELGLPKNTYHWIPEYSKNYFKSTSDKYDFMLIDGDHTYEGALVDLYGSLKILNNKGILAIDDVLHDQVRKALDEFMKTNRQSYKKINTSIKTMGFYIKQ